jgi:Kef-type K+ transport system membrane component KefB
MPPHVLPPPDAFAFILGDLALIMLAARVVGGLFVRFQQPRVVGEIVAGILIGPTVLGGHLASAALPGKPAVNGIGLVNRIYPLQAFSFLNYVGLVGLVFYMFLVGLELNTRLLRGKTGPIAVPSVAVVGVPVALGFLAFTVMHGPKWQPAGISDGTFALFLGAGLAVTAFPVMARILQEKDLLKTKMGAIGIGSATVVTVLMFLVIAAASASANHAGIGRSVGLKALFSVALMAGLLLIVRPLMGFMAKRWRPGQPIGDAVGVMLMFALATALAADRIGINSLVGGFLFGVIVPRDNGLADAVRDRLMDTAVVFFLPVFLAVSGLRTDLRLLKPGLLTGLLFFLLLMVVGKWFVGYLGGRVVGLSSDDANVLGSLLNCRGLLILVVGLIGLQLGVITQATQAVFVVGAIVTTLMTGPMVDFFLNRRARREGPEEEATPDAGAAVPALA